MKKYLTAILMMIFLSSLSLIVLGQITFASEPVYQPVGAPADPKVSIAWNRYYDYAETTRLLHKLVEQHSRLADLRSLGRSYHGREIWLMTITNPDTGDHASKPAFWIDGGIHGNEIQATEVTMYTAWYLLEMYGRNEFITRLVDERTFYLLPMLSPDSRDAHMHGPATTHSPRTGLRPFDSDRDGLFDEDGPNDLDGDGHITQMRVRDPNGRHIPHPKYPHVMIPAEPGQPGKYRLLGTEGYDVDGDGRINEDAPGGYDPNRDWPWQWQPQYVQSGAGPYPLWVGPNRMAAEFIIAHPNIAGAQSYHNTAGMILRGPGLKSERWDRADIAVFDALGKQGEDILPGYRYLTMADDLYEGHGVEVDWLYSMRGIFSFTNELFTPENFFRQTDGGRFFATEETRAKFDRLLLFGDGFVPWREVDHPQYGRIEVGGMKKSWGRQPPSFLLEEECHRNMAFTLYHAEQMPQIQFQRLEAQRLDGAIYEITAVFSNPKLIPTRAAVDVARNITSPDIIRIEGQNLSVITGHWSREPFFREANEQVHEPERLRISTVPGMGAVYARWLVADPGPWRVSMTSVKGGSVTQELQGSDSP